jgi:hypothetical protein
LDAQREGGVREMQSCDRVRRLDADENLVGGEKPKPNQDLVQLPLEDLKEAVDLVARGVISTVVDSTIPLDQFQMGIHKIKSKPFRWLERRGTPVRAARDHLNMLRKRE